MSAMAANVEMFAAVVVTGLALLLAFVSFASYRRLRHRAALLIGLAFVAFLAQGLWLVQQAYRLRGSEAWVSIVAIFDLLVLALLYLALRLR